MLPTTLIEHLRHCIFNCRIQFHCSLYLPFLSLIAFKSLSAGRPLWLVLCHARFPSLQHQHFLSVHWICHIHTHPGTFALLFPLPRVFTVFLLHHSDPNPSVTSSKRPSLSVSPGPIPHSLCHFFFFVLRSTWKCSLWFCYCLSPSLWNIKFSRTRNCLVHHHVLPAPRRFLVS